MCIFKKTSKVITEQPALKYNFFKLNIPIFDGKGYRNPKLLRDSKSCSNY